MDEGVLIPHLTPDLSVNPKKRTVAWISTRAKYYWLIPTNIHVIIDNYEQLKH